MRACFQRLSPCPSAIALLVASAFVAGGCAQTGAGGPLPVGDAGSTDGKLIGDSFKGDGGKGDGSAEVGGDGGGATCAGQSCDDGDPCTDDLCDDASKTCKHVANAACKDVSGDGGPGGGGPALAPGDLLITEIMYNPFADGAVSDTVGEWFEIHNTTGQAIDMGGATVSDLGKDKFVIPPGTVIAANGFFVMGISADAKSNGGVAVGYAYGSKMTLANAFDSIGIESNGQLVDRVSYDITKGWPNVNGVSLSLSPDSLSSIANDDAGHWCGAVASLPSGDHGTPGVANEVCQPDGDNDGVPDGSDNCPTVGNPSQADSNKNGVGDACEAAGQKCGDGVLDASEACDDGGTVSGDGSSGVCQVEPQLATGSLVISEFMVDPKAVGDDKGEWIELFNPGSGDLIVNGVTLAVGVTKTASYTIESAGPVVVPAGGYLVLGNNADVTTNGGVKVDHVYHKISLGNSASSLTLSSQGVVVDTLVYGPKWPLLAGKSAALDPTALSAAANDDPANWCKGQAIFAATGDFGTPGGANPSCSGADLDEDLDGIPDKDDNCKSDKNKDQADADGDKVGDVCDNCKMTANPDQADGNKNGVGDACEVPGCGNGVLEAGEGCDDGNLTPGDGCNAACQFETPLAVGALVITEMLANPKAVTDTVGEWIEVFNASANAIELSGLTLQVNAASQVLGGNTSIPLAPGAFATLARNGDMAINGGVKAAALYGASLTLPNSADFAVRLIAGGKVIDEVLVQPSANGWAPLGNGNSYQLSSTQLDATANDDGNHWCWAPVTFGLGDFGSPGGSNQVCGGPVDSDGDTIADAADNCPKVVNLTQADDDGDGVGNACDACPQTSAPGTPDGCISLCGNLMLDSGEECDDGNKTPGDGCTPQCKKELVAGAVIFSEIMNYSQAGPTDNGEWLELYNPSATPVDLTGWVLAYKSVKHTLLAANGKTTIDGGSYLVLGRSTTPTDNGGASVDYAYGKAFQMAYTDGSVSLVMPSGTVADSVAYSSKAPWPAAKVGSSIQLSSNALTAAANDAGTAWCGAATSFGTAGKLGSPGSANAACKVPPPPPGPAGEGSGFGQSPAPWFVPGVDHIDNRVWRLWLGWFGGWLSYDIRGM